MVTWNHWKKIATHPHRLPSIIMDQLYKPPNCDHCLTVAISAAHIAVGINHKIPPTINHRIVLNPLEANDG